MCATPGKVWRACQTGVMCIGVAVSSWVWPFLLHSFYLVTLFAMKSDSSLMQIINECPFVLSVSHHVKQPADSRVALFLSVSKGENAKILV